MRGLRLVGAMSKDVARRPARFPPERHVPKSVALKTFSPRWLAFPGRSRMGLSIECPTHRDHRLAFWFEQPLDGGLPLEPAQMTQDGARMLYRAITVDGFDGLTVAPPGRDFDALEHPGHWRGWIIDGRVWSSRVDG